MARFDQRSELSPNPGATKTIWALHHRFRVFRVGLVTHVPPRWKKLPTLTPKKPHLKSFSESGKKISM
jgi:hypothetical protein